MECNECGCTELRTSCVKSETGKFWYTVFCDKCGNQCGDDFEGDDFGYSYD